MAHVIVQQDILKIKKHYNVKNVIDHGNLFLI